jgi:hypothetical protein
VLLFLDLEVVVEEESELFLEIAPPPPPPAAVKGGGGDKSNTEGSVTPPLLDDGAITGEVSKKDKVLDLVGSSLVDVDVEGAAAVVGRGGDFKGVVLATPTATGELKFDIQLFVVVGE